jgi:hypothetical protein
MNTENIPAVSTNLSLGDRLGHWRVRWTIGRMRYMVEPGLYRVGTPGEESPVLVTANYKLTFDILRSELKGINAWILVLDTKGINVWCAAGKGTFGTAELVRRVQDTRLSDVVSHRKLLVPQLGATGISAHEVLGSCDFRVVYGPVRASDIKAFLEAGMHATEKMRRVTFTIGERLELVGAELGPAVKWIVLLVFLVLLLDSGDYVTGRLLNIVRISAPVLAGFLAGTVFVPILLPWIPGHAFSFKGAVLGAVTVGLIIALLPGVHTVPGKIQMLLLGTTVASFFAMQFTGSTTYTSPSGVEWEMRRALPFHVGAVVLVCVISIVRWLIGS